MTLNGSIAGLMELSGVGFGTSGARGLAHAMTARVCYAYTVAFLDYLTERGEVQHTVARWTMTVSLPAEAKGTHMSRFIEILERRVGLDQCAAAHPVAEVL